MNHIFISHFLLIRHLIAMVFV